MMQAMSRSSLCRSQHFVDMSLALPEGRYLLVKDPNKPVLR